VAESSVARSRLVQGVPADFYHIYFLDDCVNISHPPEFIEAENDSEPQKGLAVIDGKDIKI
jgi:hypothetical protein